MTDIWVLTLLTNYLGRITNTANKSLGFLRRNLNTKNITLRENAYKAMIVRPKLEYAAPVWGPTQRMTSIRFHGANLSLNSDVDQDT